MAPIAQRARRLAGSAGLALLSACAHAPIGQDGTRIECRGGAAEVRVIGSFNSWRAALPLARDSAGRFVGRLLLPSGRALIACQRRNGDGSPSTEPPLNAPSLEDDGFGGRNGVFEVEAPAGRATASADGRKSPEAIFAP